MKYFRKQDAATKVRILKPILDDWNDCIGDNWIVEKSDYDAKRVTIRRKEVGMGSRASLHGSLAHNITCICDAYDWCWAIYHDDKDGLYMSI